MESVDGVADVERLDGPEARPDGRIDLLVEVPHGADRRAHYDALRARLVGDLPDDLHEFFHANTDTGAWDYGRRVAERVVALDPRRRAVVIRCLVPRTFVDTNRLVDAEDQLASGGLTAGIPAYVRHPADRALLLSLHAAYLALVEPAYEAVCGAGGFALLPHTYGPRTMAIPGIGDDIVERLRAAWAPEAWAGWPLRPEIDLITRDPEGRGWADTALVDAVLEGWRALGYEARDSETYTLHPSTQGARWSTRYPGQTLGLEVRRDLLVDRFHLLEARDVDPARAARVAEPLAAAIHGWLSRRGR